MAMSPVEMVKFFREQRELYLSHLDAAVEAGDYPRVSTNLAVAFRADLMAGLIAWRHDLHSPVADFRSALSVAVQATTRLVPMAPARVTAWQDFDFASAAMISYLLDGSIDSSLTQFAEPPLTFGDADVEATVSRFLDVEIVRQVSDLNADAPSIREIIGSLPVTKRLALMRETYLAYDQIARECRVAVGSMQETIRRAEDLFRRRGRDSYFSGGVETDGGGPDNAYVVDYRLATLLKWCASHHHERVESAHAWRW